MDCLSCGTADTKIKESMNRGTTIERKRSCSCGAYFFTTEVADRKTLRVPGVSGEPPSPGQLGVPIRVSPGQVSVASRPPPGQVTTPPADFRAGGVGGGLSSGSGSGPDPESDRRGIWKEKGIWSPADWCRKFGIAWAAHHRTVSYGMSSDSKGCAALGDLLERLSMPEVAEAQVRAPLMFAEFLGSESPAVVKAKHPFAFFVTEFGALRVAPPPPTTSNDPHNGYD